MRPDLAHLREEVAHYRDTYQRFGATEGARALDRVVALIETEAAAPRPIGEILRELAPMG